MNTYVICLLTVFAADPADNEFGSVYTPLDEFVVVVRAQTLQYEELSAPVQADTLNQAPVYGAPFGGDVFGPPVFWHHQSKLFGEFMYLSARDADVSYATPVDGVTAISLPMGRVGVADLDNQPGFRVGGALMLDPWSSVTASFWHLESETSDRVSLPGGTGVVLQPDLVHPNTLIAVGGRLRARAKYDIEFDIVDLNYKALIWGGASYALNYSLGVRYAHLTQDFLVTYSIIGETTVDTNIDFKGVGPRIELDGERIFRTGILLYARAAASFLLGEFDSNYRQVDIFAGQQARIGFQDDRIVPMLELELGVGWRSPGGRIRVTAGYFVGSWFNAVTTRSLINAAQTGVFDGVNETLTFDGFTARLEYHF